MATRKQTKQIESVEQEQALVVPADLGQPKEFAVQVAEQSAEKPVQSAEKPVEQPAVQPKPSVQSVEALLDFLVYADGAEIDSTPAKLAAEYGLSLAQFNSIRRQLAAKGVVVRFKRKGRKPLVRIDVDNLTLMDDGPDEEINLVG